MELRIVRVAAAFFVSAALFSSAGRAQPVQPTAPSNGAALPPQFSLPVTTDVEDLPVMARPRPDYDPLGIPVGGFMLFPQLTLDGIYDSNVFRTTDNLLDDYYFTFSPSLRLRSNWGLNSLEFYGGTNAYQYLRYSHENLADWNVGTDGRYDIAHGIAVYANGAVSEVHESLASPNVIGNQQSPTRYYDKHADVSATVQPNRLGFNLGGTFDRYDYVDTLLIGGGLEDNNDRNFDDYQAYARAFYEFSPGYTFFLRTSYESRQFDQRAGIVVLRVDEQVDELHAVALEALVVVNVAAEYRVFPPGKRFLSGFPAVFVQIFCGPDRFVLLSRPTSPE